MTRQVSYQCIATTILGQRCKRDATHFRAGRSLCQTHYFKENAGDNKPPRPPAIIDGKAVAA